MIKVLVAVTVVLHAVVNLASGGDNGSSIDDRGGGY